MNEEKKKALIEEGNRILKHGYGTKKSDELIKIALASLTAQPVELPDYVDDLHGIGPVMSADEVIAAIRAAGYQVEGE